MKKVVLTNNNSYGVIVEAGFKNCINLSTIVLPGNLMRIENIAFAGCKKLTDVVIPDGVTELGTDCFANWPKLNTLRSCKLNQDRGSVGWISL